ncbi:MAG: hypothetical protein WDO71_13380 [Bacteroidota bacterium]
MVLDCGTEFLSTLGEPLLLPLEDTSGSKPEYLVITNAFCTEAYNLKLLIFAFCSIPDGSEYPRDMFLALRKSPFSTFSEITIPDPFDRLSPNTSLGILVTSPGFASG